MLCYCGLPIKVAAYNPIGDYISLNDKDDITDFLVPMLVQQIDDNNSGVDEIIKVDALPP